MTKLTAAQDALLRAANTAGDGTTDTTDIAKPTVWSLIKRGYITPTDDTARVAITEAGRAAITQAAAEPPPAPAEPTGGAGAGAPPASVTPKGKIGLLVGLLQQADGTTIEAMTSATGWQAHSVRGAISGAIKKGLGHTVVSAKTYGGRIYRIVTEAKG